ADRATSRQAIAAPSLARRFAVAQPSPEPAPVTIATRPVKRVMSCKLLIGSLRTVVEGGGWRNVAMMRYMRAMANITAGGEAWRELLDVLRDADQTFLQGPRADMDEIGVAAGYRHLTHLLGFAFDLYLEADAERPSFTPLALPTRKILGDNVDSIYHFAPVRGDRRYRIRGRRGNEVYLSFCVYGGKPDGEWSTRVVANISQRDLQF